MVTPVLVIITLLVVVHATACARFIAGFFISF